MEKTERNLEIVEMYLSGTTMTELTEIFELHRSTLQKILLRHGVILHKNKSSIKCDKQFFNRYTNESCYWAGFILADGNLRKNRNSLQIKLAKIDKEHLYSFLKVIDCDNSKLVKEYDDYVSLTISLDEFKNALISNFGITPQKTFTCDIINKIPKDKLKYFIRGYFDGDGSITKSTIISINFVGTTKVLTKMANLFKSQIGVTIQSKNDLPPIQYKNDIVGSIHYYGKNVIKILDYLYSDIQKHCYLKRKLEKYTQLKQEYELK